jgi:hypothetical protein
LTNNIVTRYRGNDDYMIVSDSIVDSWNLTGIIRPELYFYMKDKLK